MSRYFAGSTLGGTQQAMTTTYKTLLVLKAATASLRRGKLYELIIGTNDTPADNFVEFDISRQTADGTATTITPNPLDPGDGAAGTVAVANATAEGTITAASQLFHASLNQRATQRWVTDPDSGLVWPATNLAGLAVRCKSAAFTGKATADASFAE